MAATVMTAEFGTIHYYSSLEEYSEACLCSFFGQTPKLIGNHVNCDIFIEDNNVLISNMNTN